MTVEKRKVGPSLLEPESRGGDIAQSGFSFQDHVVLARIPLWLSRDSFAGMTRESIGDTEARFYVPGRGCSLEIVEAKDHSLIPSEFWAEVKRFRAIDAGSPGTYQWFTLVSAGLSQDLKPLVHSLRRVRDPYGFYEAGSAVQEHSFTDYVEVVKKLGYSEETARFLFERIQIEADWDIAQHHGEALLRQSLVENLPEYEDLSGKVVTDIYARLGAFVRKHLNQPIARIELEGKMREGIDPQKQPPHRPVLIHTASRGENEQSPGLCFNWVPFFGGESRLWPPPEVWEQQLMRELRETKDWIDQYRGTKRVRLTGNRRLSASLAIGSVFSAVAGFVIDMDYRGESWTTDAHPIPDTREYPLVLASRPGTGDNLVVTVGIIRNIVPEVESDLERHGLRAAPALYVRGDHAITSPMQANLASRAVKHAISDALASSGASLIHLFFAGPAFFALFLGHQLNATAPFQCYERIAVGRYVPTCRLFASGT